MNVKSDSPCMLLPRTRNTANRHKVSNRGRDSSITNNKVNNPRDSNITNTSYICLCHEMMIKQWRRACILPYLCEAALTQMGKPVFCNIAISPITVGGTTSQWPEV